MFTGLIERIGKIESILPRGNGLAIRVSSGEWDEPLTEGESISVNGACLTASKVFVKGFEADVLRETIERTSLRVKSQGALVNLERALRPYDRIGGHMVSGHIDETGTIQSIKRTGSDYILRAKCSPARMPEIVTKGSVALDGISLTVTDTNGSGWFEVHVIPHTWTMTALSAAKIGDYVNIESDIIAKYVRNLICTPDSRGTILDQMKNAGFPLTHN